LKNPGDTNETSSQNNITDTENNNSTLANDGQEESNEGLACADTGETTISVENNNSNNLDADGKGIG
jgi:hypothetical protein